MRAIATFVLLALASTAAAQEWPKPTEDGKKALDELIHRCVAAGGLAEAKDPKTGATSLVLGDPTRLRNAVAADRALLTPALRDALVTRWPQSGDDQRSAILALLRAMDTVAHDRLAASFVTYFDALGLKGKDAGAALALFEQAADQFQSMGEQNWQATCLNESGVIRAGQGEYGKALQGFQKALEIRRATLGERHPDVAQSYTGIANVYWKQGELARALEVHQKALEIRCATLGRQHPKVAQSYHNIAIVYYEQGELVRALETHQKALEIFRATLGERHPNVASSYNNIANVYSHQGELARALETYQKALEIFRATLGERHPDVAGSYYNIANVYSKQGERVRALETHQKAIEIRRATLGERHPDVANSYTNIGLIFHDQGKLAEALEAHQKALEIFRATLGERHPDVTRSSINIALVYFDQGNLYYEKEELARALEAHQKALEIFRVMLGERHPKVADSYNAIALVYHDQGELARALEAHQKALEIRRATLGEQHPDVASSYNNIAIVYADQGELVVYHDQGKLARALEAHQKALEIRRATLGERHPDVAESYNNIAVVYRDQGDLPRALEAHQKALEIFRATLGERHRDVAQSYNNIAIVYADQGELARALDYFQKALEIDVATLGERHPDVAQCYSNIALVYRNQGQPDQALRALDRALNALNWAADPATPTRDLRTASQDRSLPLTVRVLSRRGHLRESNLGPNPSAGLRACLSDYRTAADVLEQIRDHSAIEDDKLRHGETASDLFPRTVGVAARLAQAEDQPEALRAALEAAERGAARVFLEGLGRSHAHVVGHVTPSVLAEEARLAARVRQLDAQIDKEQAKPFETRDRAAVERLFLDRRRAGDEWQTLIARLERDFPQYTALKYPRPCTLDEARACLADDEVALLYMLGSEASYLVVVAKDDDPKMAGLAVHRLAPAGEIAELVAALTQPTVLEDADGARELGARAYRTLVAPAAEVIRGKGLVLVPGGALGLLPFELLIEPAQGPKDDGRFLVEGHRLRYAPSLTALHFVRQWDQTRTRPEQMLWAMGDPIYQPTDERLTARTELAEETRYAVAKYRGGVPGSAFERLPSSGVEVEQLRRLWEAPPEAIRLGPAATEAAVKAASVSGTLARYRYVHFATHGILGLADGTPPSLVLALAGDQQGEDGFLRLDEVTSLKLNADLVVLSACQTGQGKLSNAEGVSGLARAFLYAGSRAVLCSLWRVDDQATATLMTDIYAGLKASRSAPEALRSAQLQRIAAGEAPLSWAPFILIGQ